jgi:hypothetical protein
MVIHPQEPGVHVQTVGWSSWTFVRPPTRSWRPRAPGMRGARLAIPIPLRDTDPADAPMALQRDVVILCQAFLVRRRSGRCHWNSGQRSAGELNGPLAVFGRAREPAAWHGRGLSCVAILLSVGAR